MPQGQTKRKKDDIPLKVLSGNLILQYLISSFWGCRQSSQDLCFWVSSDLEQPFPYLKRFQWFDLVTSINLEWSNLQILNFITSLFKCLHMQKCQDVLLRLVRGYYSTLCSGLNSPVSMCDLFLHCLTQRHMFYADSFMFIWSKLVVEKDTEDAAVESDSEWLTEGLGLLSFQTTTAQVSLRIYSCFQGEPSPQIYALTLNYIFC